MARLFPFRSETTARDGQPRVVDLEGEDADAVFSALSSTTARRIYARLDEEPGTPSDVADAIDSSIQNVRYHLENLEEAGLVEVVDTWYSSRGNEMSVYATTDGPLIVTSDESTASQLKTAISRLIGGIGALAGGSLLVQYGVGRWLDPAAVGTTEDATPSTAEEPTPTAADDPDDDYLVGDDAADDPVDAPDEEPDAETEPGMAGVEEEEDADEPDDDAVDDLEADDDVDDTAGDEPVEEPEAVDDEAVDDSDAADLDAADDVELEGARADDSAEPYAVDPSADGGTEAVDAMTTLPPGLLFFLGGLVVLLAVTAYWYWYRPVY
ncbi:ArsR/SmtB family transcription factor [Natrarchaeobius oligotrophus]|uniref:ArsR family transcriptional regulator n=1 Tax=Natrarchaeobius chitinivorans TaxID=1679083 RepID=A0A3N6MNW0_NATCH|nr:helix-turn-helix domain-containing protein [Natrarchaeobius chitinivorans]RQH03375.1 ArsR family transcriptional regulator [Natrarchaeobius chitinivorans]